MESTISPNTPALTPPPGVTPNFVDPPSAYQAWVILKILIMTLLTLFLTLRIASKVFFVKKWHLEDTFSLLAYGIVIAWVVIGSQERFAKNITRHQYNVRMIDLPFVWYTCYILGVLYTPGILLSKLSVLFQIKRIFTAGVRNAFFYLIWGTIVFTIVFYIISTFLFIFICTPRQKLWQPSLPGHCMDLVTLEIFIAAINVVSDFMILGLPIWAISRLQAKRKRRIELSIIFGCGLFACIIGVVGMVYRIKLVGKEDAMQTLNYIHLFCFAEDAMVIIVGCVPAAAKVVTGIEQKLGLRMFDSPVSSAPYMVESGRLNRNSGSQHSTEGVSSNASDRHDTLASFSKYFSPEDVKNGSAGSALRSGDELPELESQEARPAR